MKGKTVAVIPARGGSKGIPKKNLVWICGKPLIAWSVLHAKAAKRIDTVWVTSDDDEILAVAQEYGALSIKRPMDIAGDTAASESAWLHALEVIKKQDIDVGLVVGMQATSPLRDVSDLDSGIEAFQKGNFDSVLSVVEVEDYFSWRIDKSGLANSVNYDYRDRKRRQQIEKRYLENGSFYIFRPENLRRYRNRLGKRIGLQIMDRYKMFQIDNPDDIVLCEAVMRAFGLDLVQ